jgi:hypothetical protein
MLHRYVLPLAVAVVLTACAPVSVGSHYANEVRFAGYHTFAWGTADELPTGDPRLDHNPFFNDYVVGAVERHLQQHGIALAAASANADLLVHYHASVTRQFDVSTWRHAHDGEQEPRIVLYDQSTIVLDLVNARTNRLVWRGWAQEYLQNYVNDQDALKAHIEQSMARMLKQLPI